MTAPIAATSLLATVLSAAAIVAQEPDAAAVRQQVFDKAAKSLAEHGYAVPDGVQCQERKAREVIADFDAQQDVLMPAGAFELQHALFSGFGLRAGDDADELREQTIASMARGLSAYYDPLRKVFVMLPSATREMAEALGGGALPLVTHELVHAHQDGREGGIVGYFAAESGTLDRSLARRVVLEGEAELVAAMALAGGDAGVERMRDSLAMGMLDSLFAGEMTGIIYDAGRRLALSRYDIDGIDAVRALWQAPPASCEQAMHASKYGVDAPVAVTVPKIEGLTAARQTTLGELLLHSLLRLIEVPRLDASLAAAGWDGDRLVAFDRGDDRDVALVWRSVWDRDEDAADFAQRLQQRGRGVTEVVGRVVDWVLVDDSELRQRVLAACAADRTPPSAVEADAVSTAAVEAALREQMGQSSSDGHFWHHEAVGLSVPIPDGWEVKEVNGVEMLIDQASAKTGFALNANVMKVARGPMENLTMLIDANQAQMAQMKLTVERFEIVERDGVEVVEGEYHGKIGRMQPMHFLLLAYLRGDQQVFVTVTSSQALWAGHQEELRKLMAGIRVTKE